MCFSNIAQALGVTELGSPFHRPLTNPDGSVILSLVSHIRNPKSVLSLSLKWVPLSKVGDEKGSSYFKLNHA